MNTQTRTARWRQLAALLGIALILAAPSIWFLCNIPPLWRDVDAYIQVTGRPGAATVLLHGPLYGFIARVPLYFGHFIESSAPNARSFVDFFLAPSLTDSGVVTLLLLQHAALIATQFGFVAAVASGASIRLFLAVCLASNPLLYTFAHCVGSETLSAVGIVLLATLGWRILRNEKATSRDWIALAVVLLLLMLPRQINAILVVLLPLALLPLLPRNRARGSVASAGVRRFVAAIVVSLAAVAISHGSARLIALAADVDYRSKIGFTFMWRLQFLQKLSPTERERVVQDAAAKARSPETKATIGALAELFGSPEPPNFVEFVRRQQDSLFPPRSADVSERTDAALNGMPLAFALGSPAALVRAAAADFVTAREMRISTVTNFLFWTTVYYVGREEAPADLAKLVTFRAFTAKEITAMPLRFGYLRWWDAITYNGWLAIWLLAFAALLITARIRRVSVVTTCSYATALLLTALLLMLVNCFFTELLPRYTVPMFELTFLSLVLLVGRIAEIAVAKPEAPLASS